APGVAVDGGGQVRRRVLGDLQPRTLRRRPWPRPAWRRMRREAALRGPVPPARLESVRTLVVIAGSVVGAPPVVREVVAWGAGSGRRGVRVGRGGRPLWAVRRWDGRRGGPPQGCRTGQVPRARMRPAGCGGWR